MDTAWFAAAIELDGTVRESIPFGDGRELFNTGKYLNKLIENTWRTKIFESNIFVICKVLPKFTKILYHKYLEPYRDGRGGGGEPQGGGLQLM